MSKNIRRERRSWGYAVVVLAAISAGTGVACAAPMPLVQGSAMFTAGMPTGGSPDGKMNQYAVTVNYFLNGKDNSGGLGMATVPVPNIPATAGLPTPTAAQVAAASAAKAKAIVDAINAAKLPGVMASVDANTMAGMYPTGMTEEYKSKLNGKTYTRPVMGTANFTTYTVDGVRQSVNPNNGLLGSPVMKAAVDAKGKPTNTNVTGEVGDLKNNFKPAGKAVGMFNGGMTGTGAVANLSTGMDDSGFPSVVGFGFIDQTSSMPVDYFATIEPDPEMSNQDVLTSLADIFNSEFDSSGYSASYDPYTDTILIDQPLPGVDSLWSANSDTGLNFESDTLVPEPASISLVVLGLVTRIVRRRQ